MFKRDHQAAEQSEADVDGHILFPAHEQSAMIAEPGDSAFNDPTVAIPAQRSTVLRAVFRPSIAAVWSDHLDAQIEQERVQRIRVVSLVANEALGLAVVGKQA